MSLIILKLLIWQLESFVSSLRCYIAAVFRLHLSIILLFVFLIGSIVLSLLCVELVMWVIIISGVPCRFKDISRWASKWHFTTIRMMITIEKLVNLVQLVGMRSFEDNLSLLHSLIRWGVVSVHRVSIKWLIRGRRFHINNIEIVSVTLYWKLRVSNFIVAWVLH